MLTTYCGDHFAIYTDIELLSCTHETSIILYVNYASTKEGWKEGRKNCLRKSLKQKHRQVFCNPARMVESPHMGYQQWNNLNNLGLKDQDPKTVPNHGEKVAAEGGL